MDLKDMKVGTIGEGPRRLGSWIGSFVEYTGGFLETPEVFRRWTAISAVAAILERKVWIDTGSRLFPNLYIMIIGPSATGKTRVIDTMLDIIREIPEFYVSPTSMTTASMIDCLHESKRSMPMMGVANDYVDYNTMYVAVDELSAFMHKYDYELVAGLTKFYDCNWYKQVRRTARLSITIDRPQLNLICGSTPTNLMELMPSFAWTQGFTGRTILVYSTLKNTRNLLEVKKDNPAVKNLIHDALVISNHFGRMDWTKDYEQAMLLWRNIGNKQPEPNHPNLVDYNARRETHVLKLSMVAAIDRGSMTIDRVDFDMALSWLIAIEKDMPAIFEAGAVTDDAKVQSELLAFLVEKNGASNQQIVRFLMRRIPSHAVGPTIELLKISGQITLNAKGKWVPT